MPAERRVKLVFDHFDTESGHDYLKIYDGPSGSSSLLASLDGQLSTPHVIMSTGSALWFTFETDSSGAKPGFRATFTSIEGISDVERFARTQ